MNVLFLLVSTLPAQAPTPPEPARNPITPPYDVLRPDAAWCGPRVLYFLSCYLEDREASLDQVVSLCRSDQEGYTTLLDLVQAARKLDLEPTPITCSADQLLSLGGPAIIGVGRPASPTNRKIRLHFVGLICKRGQRYLVIDPSLRAEPILVPAYRIRDSFTGHAVLIRGCPRPVEFSIEWPMLLVGFIVGLGAPPLVMLFYRRSRLGAGKGGAI